MKALSKIITSLTVLILLVFGTGGIGVAKCNCSGKTSLVLPIERGCCPTESDCMSITVAHISDYEAPQYIEAPQPVVISCCQLFGYPKISISRSSLILDSGLLDNPPPPTDIVGTIVLRV